MEVVKVAASGLFLLTGAAQLATSLARRGRLMSALMLLCFGVALVLTLDPPYLALDRAVGVPNLAELVSHLAGLFGIGVMTYLLLDVDGRGQLARRRELAALGVVLFATTVLFATSDVPQEAPEFAATYGRQTPVLAFWALSSTYALVCLLRLARTVARSTPSGTRRDVVHGMRVAAVGGGVFGAAYIALKAVEIAGAYADHDIAGIRAWQQATLAPGMACLAMGLGLPLAARMIGDARHQIRERLALLRLRRRRRELVDRGLIPDEDPLSSRASVVVDLLGSGPDARLLRRVVEIRDALLLDGSPLADPTHNNGMPQALARGLDLLGEADRLSAKPTTAGTGPSQ